MNVIKASLSNSMKSNCMIFALMLCFLAANSQEINCVVAVNHQKVQSLDLKTNEYGTFSGSFIAPNNGLNGQMHIKDAHGIKYFSVEEIGHSFQSHTLLFGLW